MAPDEVVAPRSLKEKQRQEREDLILRVAEEVILEKGYHETSMDEIAARVGIAKGTLYLHFSRKEELVMALFRHELENFLLIIEQVRALDMTPQAKLERLLHDIYLGLLGKRARLLYTAFNTADLQVMIHTKQQSFFLAISEQVMAIMDEGKAAGSFTEDIPTIVMFSTFMSLLSPRTYKHLIIEKGISLDDLVSYVARIYFRGVAVQA